MKKLILLLSIVAITSSCKEECEQCISGYSQDGKPIGYYHYITVCNDVERELCTKESDLPEKYKKH